MQVGKFYGLKPFKTTEESDDGSLTVTEHVRMAFDVLPHELADIKQFDELKMTQQILFIGGRDVLTPRLQTAYGDDGLYYSFAGSKARANTWTPFLVQIKEHMENLTNLTFNFVLINKYRNGEDTIGWHSDDERELRGPVVSISIGATRDFIFKHNETKETHTLPLPHNSCIVFDRFVNSKYKHSVPRRKRCKEVRYNLTFRTINNTR